MKMKISQNFGQLFAFEGPGFFFYSSVSDQCSSLIITDQGNRVKHCQNCHKKKEKKQNKKNGKVVPQLT